MKKLVCRKCHWFLYYPPKPQDLPNCPNCNNLYNYNIDIEEDDIRSLPVDWSKRKG